MIHKILLSVIFFTGYIGLSQVGINTLSPNARLDIKASSQTAPASTDGILIPVIDEFPASDPGLAQDGMLVFATGNGSAPRGVYYWDNVNSSWLNFSDEIWRLGGNSGTDGGTSDFIGTTDNQPIVFRVNNTNRMRVTDNGQIEMLNTNQSVFLGEFAGPSSTGLGNVLVGYNSGNGLTTGQYNVLIGVETGTSMSSLSNNTYVGSFIGSNVTTGTLNTYIGSGAGGVTTTGSSNTMVGLSAGQRNNTGELNVLMGRGAGLFNYAGNNNVYLGSLAGEGNFDASEALSYSNNVFLGTRSGENVAGSNNVFIGYESGRNEAGSNRLYIENSNSTTPLIGGDFSSNRVGINRAIGSLNNTLEVGGTASKATAGAWLGNSDRRLKKNIRKIDGETALGYLSRLRGVTFEWNDDHTGMPRPQGVQFGFIAQEIMEVFPEKVSRDNLGYYQTAYGDYDPLLIEAIKELNQKIEDKNSIIESLEQRLERLEALLNTANTTAKETAQVLIEN